MILIIKINVNIQKIRTNVRLLKVLGSMNLLIAVQVMKKKLRFQKLFFFCLKNLLIIKFTFEINYFDNCLCLNSTYLSKIIIDSELGPIKNNCLGNIKKLFFLIF